MALTFGEDGALVVSSERAPARPNPNPKPDPYPGPCPDRNPNPDPDPDPDPKQERAEHVGDLGRLHGGGPLLRAGSRARSPARARRCVCVHSLALTLSCAMRTQPHELTFSRFRLEFESREFVVSNAGNASTDNAVLHRGYLKH